VQRFIENLGLAPADRVRTIHYGIDPSGWLLSEGERARAREDLGLAPHEVAVGVASRLVPDKGHGFLFDAISEALSKEPELRLLVAGGGPLRGSLESYARSHLPPEAFRFLGHVTDIRGFMNACDVVAFPSLPGFGEGFGLAALEAMAAAKPVVASAIDSLPEIVMDGETGFLVPPGKTSELGEKLATLASNPGLREELGGRGHQRAASSFTVEAMVNKTLRVYREIVQ
jgi:glycosyltransferase involved in cell wall biosynthesis